MTGEEPIYWVSIIPLRGGPREEYADPPESRDAAYELRDEIARKHPRWLVRVKVIR